MTLERYNKYKEQFAAEQLAIYNKAEKLIEAGEYSVATYKKIGAFETFAIDYFTKIYEETVDLEGYDAEDTIKELNTFIEFHKSINAVNKTDIEQNIVTYDEGGVEYFNYSFSYYVLSTKEMLQKRIDNRVERNIDARLKPNSELYIKEIDCALMSLFEDGTIDWATLQKLVYKDCDL